MRVQNEELMERAVFELGKDSPFYNFLLLFIDRIPSSVTRTVRLRVTSRGRFQLLYNPDVLGNKPLAFTKALLKHECLHIVNGHILIPVNRSREKVVWDLAMDAAVNQYIPELDAFSLPLDSLLSEGCGTDNERFFVGPPMAHPGETAEFYHSWAMDFMRKNRSIDLELLEGNLSRVDSHEDFGSFELPKEFIEDLLKQVVSETLEKARTGIPEGLEDVMKLVLDNPVLDWRNVIRRFFGSSTYVGRYRTPMRPNRRYDDQPGWKSDYAAKLVVVVDTSGSVIEDEFNAFFGEIDAVTRITDSRIWLVQVDETVQSVMKYGKGMWRDLKLVGRGETDLQPAVDYSQENLRPEGLIIFTDGYTDLPSVARRVLFVLSKSHNPDFASEARSIYGKSSVVFLS
jgi:predicted metal-dependent peptidase